MSLLTDAEKKALCRRYPEWEKRILEGDFRIEILADTKSIVWPNTSVFSPTHLDVNTVISKEFPGVQHRWVKFTSGIMSLTISGPHKVRHE
jgi:hypothetical protein